ncbi:hypothetical protein niasHT_027949 [Heterodera trifolii]|uniref:RNA-directed DNA polymerase n=1 Tax=Heterodera trifolii TaxID=157864 RepID=A0ABD2JB73_9BILA
MKNLAKQFVYWPKIDLDIDRWVRNCEECALAAKAPPKVPLQPWPASTQVYERLHMDFAGPCADGTSIHTTITEYFNYRLISTPHLLASFGARECTV